MQAVKQCSRCGETKPLSAFRPRRDGKDGLNARCRDCLLEWQREYDAARREEIRVYGLQRRATPEHRAYMKAYREANRERLNTQSRERRRIRVAIDPSIRRRAVEAQQRIYRRKREIANEAKVGGCIRCGELELAALDFHHRNPSERLFTLGSNIASRTVEAIKAEIAKCDVLCANCHRKLHAGRLAA